MKETPSLQVKHRYRAPPEKVFDAFLNVDQARRFLFATEEGQMVEAEIDPRVGGKFRFVDRRPDGDAEHIGEYLEIDRPRRLVFQFTPNPDATTRDRATVEIEPQPGGSSVVTLTQTLRPEFVDYIDQGRKGWTDILRRLERVVS